MSSILIIEDDVPLSNGIVLALRENERQFTQCFDISSAKLQLEKQQFALIILDINLPDGNGLVFCRWVRTFSAVPVLILTANDSFLYLMTLGSGVETFRVIVKRNFFDTGKN